MEGTGRKWREREGTGERSGEDRGRKWREQRGKNGGSVRGRQSPKWPRRTKTMERNSAGPEVSGEPLPGARSDREKGRHPSLR